MTDAAIELANVSVRFADMIAVDHLSLSVAQGEIVALVGRTGAGKSTVMNLIMGTLRPNHGSVRVGGHDPANSGEALRGVLGASFQTDRLLPWRRALDNAALGLQILGQSRDQARTTAASWLARLKLIGCDSKYPHELSGGMRQRVSLARALAVDPPILLLDETFSQLDAVTSRALRQDIGALIRDLGKTCLFITHRIEDAVEMADRVVVLAPGARIVMELSPTEMDHSAAHNQIADAMETASGA